MERYLRLFIAALAIVGVLVSSVQADDGAEPDSVKFIWALDIPGVLTIPLDNLTMQEGETFRWQAIAIPSEYQGLVGPYWEAMGNSSVTLNEGAIHQNVTVVITVQPGATELFGYSIPISLQFDVYDGLAPGNDVTGMTLFNPSGTHFNFDRPDGIVLYFDLNPEFEELFLSPLGLTREGLTLAFVEQGTFTQEGITVSATYDENGLINGLIGEVSHLSTIVMVPQAAVTPVEASPWGAIKTLYR